jgi:transposase
MAQTFRLHYRIREKLVPYCRGSTPARVARRARVLLCLDEGQSVDEVAETVDCGTATVKRVRRRFREQGWEAAIMDAPRPGRPKKLKSREEQELIALACSDPPKGEGRWTVGLLAKHFGKDISRSIVQRVLKEDGLKPWREKNVVRAGARRRVQGADV